MTVTCIVCKKFSITGINIRSFHKFPSDGILREKWISALSLVKVPKTATVCSDHFDEESFHQTDGYTKIRRLLANAVPSTSIKAISNAEKKAIQNDEKIITACPTKSNNPTNNIPMDRSKYETNKNFNSVHTKPLMLLRVLSVQTEDTCLQPISVNENSCEYTSIQGNSNSKRLLSENSLEVPCKKTKEEQDSKKRCSKVGFMDGYVKKYICREDFVSDEAWQRFLRFKKCKELKNEAVRQQKARVMKKIINFQEMVTTLKEKETQAAAQLES